ncbi:Peptidoglycan/LPS O-acetylase OafA/YrhL, contains acyltransferase and SGNH-hydrolase domains [Mucilaginibacter mallensis]|uniref:Peptidoglycan/LPS O-acetylase OafA/YrhL, contains acyltransferase and SGNH-hydrolase domains n=1 Tax=Mucilaginibacter mallensis TaxID=652787 RepID=A0A1H1SYD1_MUCMA|nr:acyltransferase family protein [Mucilaginibacter mallensis]SDS52726.1 Peptidoglycan/LPS O-acetylase OafA/YrhL, contains acyltransferase and SGNH-hydrolase domains [Mucilaginibacter mallensis]
METTQRQTYLDWLRIFSILGVLLFHSAMPYVSEEWWHIKNHDTSNLLMESNFFLHLVRMPLLFFISGTVSYYMMQKRSSLSFIGLRFRRLFIPLAVGMFVIVPPQIYMERLNNGYTGSYWEFYKTVFNFVPYPKGSFSWHHLWFIAYLFVYDIIFAPFFAWMTSPKSEAFRNKLAVLAEGKWVYMLMLPGVLWFVFVTKDSPETNNLVQDLPYFVYWLLFVLGGFICITQPKLMDSLERNRRFALTIGFLAFLLIDILRWNKIEPEHERWPFDNSGLMYDVFYSLWPIVAWAWVLALVGYGKRYLNRKLKVLNYLNQAVYPFYILHQTVIVILVYYIVPLHEDVLIKYIYTVGFTFFITMGLYHLLIMPFPAMRFLFGMKPAAKIKSTVAPGPENVEQSILISA